MTGMAVLGAMLLVYYWRQSAEKHFSMLEILLALLVFLIGPVTVHFPGWFLVLFVVLLVLMLGEKRHCQLISNWIKKIVYSFVAYTRGESDSDSLFNAQVLRE